MSSLAPLPDHPRRVRPPLGLRWRSLLRAAFGVACDGCGERLPVGAHQPLCITCDRDSEPIGVWQRGPGDLPVLAGWRYSGALADAIVAAKFRGRPFAPGPWLHAVADGLSEVLHRGDQLLPIPPQRRRLVSRGYSLPDEIARRLARQLPTAARPEVDLWRLRRSDLSAPRSADATVRPQFQAIGVGPAVWIVDDVVTTGHTVEAAVAALRAAGTQVRGVICLADAGPRREPVAAGQLTAPLE